MMGVGRLLSDPGANRYGDAVVARSGAMAATAGLGLALATSAVAAALAGFALMGMGLAALFPLTLRAAARNVDTAGPNLAAVSSIGYLGFLLGPPTIGALAEQAGLRAALLLVCGACVLIALGASRIGAESRSAG